MRRLKERDKIAIKLLVVIILATVTIHAMFWTFNTFDPHANPLYRNVQLQFGFQLMHMLLFFWMLIAVLTMFWGVFAKSKKGKGR